MIFKECSNLRVLSRFLKSIQGASTFSSYPHLINNFANIGQLKLGDIVVGAHMVYGWIPTIVHLDKGQADPLKVVDLLQSIKNGVEGITEFELNVLVAYINNSVVGASKMLHFIALERFPIWDSKR
jgi:hypothetical protein